MKKLISLLLALVLLMSMSVVVAAEDVPVIKDKILNSVMEDDGIGYSVAFLIEVNAAGVQVVNSNEFDGTNATVQHNGEAVSLVSMGAVATLDPTIANDPAAFTVSNGLNVPAKYLCHLEDTMCRFAVRITNVPAANRDSIIYVRPYYVIEVEGEQQTVYADVVDEASYLDVWAQNQDEIVLPAVGTDVDANAAGYVTVSDASYGYKLDAAGEIVTGVNLTLKNNSTLWNVEDGSWVEYTYYNAAGDALGTGTFSVDGIDTKANTTKTVTFDVPAEIASVALTDSSITYELNPVALPAIGTDIDVAKKKNRIKVSATSYELGDECFEVSLTFRNYSTNWITEETDYVKYTYYDANGNQLGTGTIYIGVIDTKKNKVKTFNFEVPLNTAEVKLTSSKIVYWTEWS